MQRNKLCFIFTMTMKQTKCKSDQLGLKEIDNEHHVHANVSHLKQKTSKPLKWRMSNAKFGFGFNEIKWGYKQNQNTSHNSTDATGKQTKSKGNQIS